ncbi:MAG: TGS domain-containing protein [Fuerstiella sp.]
MPANLTPMYYKAERDYRRAQTAQEQVDGLQRMLQLIPRHKGTDKLQADLKSRLSEARKQLKIQLNAPKGGQVFRIPRQGAGRVVILGGPNGGKSRILQELTDARPEVAEFPFTTRTPLPAMLHWQGVQIQLVDTPPVTPGQLPPWLLNLVRTADGVLLVADGSGDQAIEDTLAVIQEFEDRKTRFTETGGFDEQNYSIVNVASRVVMTHGRDAGSEIRLELLQETGRLKTVAVVVDLDDPELVESLKRQTFEMLNVIRVCTRPPGGPPDLQSPLTIPAGGTVEDLALQIHEDLAQRLKHARLWRGGDHEGQIVGREYQLRDGDVVELH